MILWNKFYREIAQGLIGMIVLVLACSCITPLYMRLWDLHHMNWYLELEISYHLEFAKDDVL